MRRSGEESKTSLSTTLLRLILRFTSVGRLRIGQDNPVAYVTTVGLYNSANELLAVAKLSEPLKKSVDNELTIRVRLDY